MGMKEVIEWTEGDITRGRKLMLFITIISFIGLVFLVLFIYLVGWGDRIAEFKSYFAGLGALAITAIGFYTGTAPKDKFIDEIAK